MTSIENAIHICITDDQQVFRNGLIVSLEPYHHVTITGEAGSGEALLDLLRSMDRLPDVVLLDVKMKQTDGIETTRIIRKRFPSVKVIGLSIFESHHHILAMFKAGCNGYLSKNANPDEIIEAIETVVEKDFYFNRLVSATFLKSVIEKDHSPKTDDTHAVLNATELSLLKLICSEHINIEIADKMNLSIKTIENYRNRLLAKTGSKNTAGLVMYAVKNGHLVIDETY